MGSVISGIEGPERQTPATAPGRQPAMVDPATDQGEEGQRPGPLLCKRKRLEEWAIEGPPGAQRQTQTLKAEEQQGPLTLQPSLSLKGELKAPQLSAVADRQLLALPRRGFDHQPCPEGPQESTDQISRPLGSPRPGALQAPAADQLGSLNSTPLLAADRLHPEQVRPVGSASECWVHLESVKR